MLTPSQRHTPEDLSLWREYEAADLIYDPDRLAILERESIETIRRFRDQGLCYLSASGGKDSSVLWALVYKSGCDIRAWHLNTRPLADPHVADVLRRLDERFPLNLTVVENWCRLDARGWHATGTFEDGIRRIVEQSGTDRYICGIRAEESSVRKISSRVHGKTTAKSCRPLLHWRASDVYAYAAQNGVPLHPNYAMLGGGLFTRDRLRVSFLGLKHGTGMGRAEWENTYYSDVLRRIATGNPADIVANEVGG